MKNIKFTHHLPLLFTTFLLFYLFPFIVFLYTGFDWVFALTTLISLLGLIFFLKKFQTQKNKKTLKHFLKIITILFLIPFLYISFITSKYEIKLNPYYDSILPQEKLVEIRPVIYDFPSTEIYEAHQKGEIYYTGMDSKPTFGKDYILLIKFFRKHPTDLMLEIFENHKSY